MAERDNTSPRFGNWRVIPRVDDGRVEILRGALRKPLAVLTPADARGLADVLVVAARQLEEAA